jgi:hypothetical protein
MRPLKDEHAVVIDGHRVAVTGSTGLMHATWTLLIDGEPADTAKAAGDFKLRGSLGNGSRVEAAVHQSLVGPTWVVIRHEGEDVRRFTGFVA